MIITEKLGDALLIALAASQYKLTRCHKGFRPEGQLGQMPVVTRRTANALVNACLADYNDRTVPSALTLTPKGVAMGREHASRTADQAP